MARMALISRHIVLTQFQDKVLSYPVSGIVLILDGLISDVLIYDSNFSASVLLQEFATWNPIDYSDFYISPGIIDTNTRLEWDSFDQLTKESLKGGVTCVVAEPGHYQSPPETQSLYCDVAKLSVIDESITLTHLPPDTSVLKAYLFPPAPSIKSISNLDFILSTAQSSTLPLILDPTMPDPRMLYMASPHRLEAIEERSRPEQSSNSKAFAAAFPESIKSSSSEDSSINSSESDTEFSLPTKSVTLQYGELKVVCRHRRSSSNEETDPPSIGAVEEEEPQRVYRPHKSFHDIYQDLEDRIKESEKSIEDLCKAESSTYRFSGSTSFMLEIPKKSHSMVSVLEKSPESVMETEKRRVRPAPIQIKNAVKPDVLQDYNYFLANCPESWEIMGLEKVFECMKSDYCVHVSGVSSAAAINKVRHEKKKFKGLSCEIPASNLCFTSASVAPADCRFKACPPIRNQGNCNLLWDLLKMKGIDTVCSSHANIDTKLKLTGNFQQSISGISSAGLILGSVWNMLNIPVSTNEQLEHYIVRLAKWLSLNPAKILKLNHERGRIDKGLRADIIVWNPHKKFLLQSEYSYTQTSPFMQQELMGQISKVYIKGELALDNQELTQPLGKIINKSY